MVDIPPCVAGKPCFPNGQKMRMGDTTDIEPTILLGGYMPRSTYMGLRGHPSQNWNPCAGYVDPY